MNDHDTTSGTVATEFVKGRIRRSEPRFTRWDGVDQVGSDRRRQRGPDHGGRTDRRRAHPLAVPHPGEELWADWLDPLNLTVGAAAKALGVSRKTMSELINGHRGVSAKMSIRLSKALGTEPAYWALRQLEFDLGQVDDKQIKVSRLVPRNGDE